MKCVVHATVCGLTWRWSTLSQINFNSSFNFLIIFEELIIIILNLDIIALWMIIEFLLLILCQIIGPQLYYQSPYTQ